MSNPRLLWALLLCALASGALAPELSRAADGTVTSATSNVPPGGLQGQGIVGAGTYPGSGPTKIQVPTPDTLPLSGSTSTATGVGTANGSFGRFRNKRGEVNIQAMLLDRYSTSVVRVAAKDLSGNVLARSMGVGIGRNTPFIAVPLSLVLGSAQQWADRIEVTHAAGNKYEAKVALIDEEKNLALLVPDAAPATMNFARDVDERPNIDVFTFSYDATADGQFTPAIHRAHLAAANPETGLLSISPYPGQTIDDNQSGTAIIDSSGNLIGMLLPGGRGVLASTLQKATVKAQKAAPIEPRMIGVILGRGVLVDPKHGDGYKTISAALEAIKTGKAPKADPTRYTPARNRTVAPKESDKVVIRVMPGTYREGKTIALPSHVSLSGSGPALTTLIGSDPKKPVVLIQNAENVMVSGFRLTPASLQELKAPTVIISKATKTALLGNLIEAKGGVAVWVHESRNTGLFGNTLGRGHIRGVSCDHSDIQLQGNAFVGDWPIALALEAECVTVAQRNLFLENKISVDISSLAGSTSLRKNTFVRSPSAVKSNGGAPRLTLAGNLFYECNYALLSMGEVRRDSIGRNAAWRSKMVSKSHPLLELDLVRSEPLFEDPGNYDFRIQPGSAAALRDLGNELGAYQRSDFVGPFSGQLARSLGAAAGEESFSQSWGLPE